MAQCNSCVLSAIDDGEVAEFVVFTKPKGRKEHVCTECRRVIQVGEVYERLVGIWAGRLQVFNTCSDCQSIRDVLFCEGSCLGMLREDILIHLEDVGTISEDCIARLTPRARDMICDMVEEQWAWEDEEE